MLAPLAQLASMDTTLVAVADGQAMDLFGIVLRVGQQILRYLPVVDKVVEQVTAYNSRQWAA
jgi:hypothetical protein